VSVKLTKYKKPHSVSGQQSVRTTQEAHGTGLDVKYLSIGQSRVFRRVAEHKGSLPCSSETALTGSCASKT
jgi:hypothetical protein